MVRNYKRKTDRGRWSEEQMKLAIQEVLDGKKGYKLASKTYNVPQTTLERKVNQARKRDNNILNVKVPLGSITTVFSEEEEQILVTYLKEMEGKSFGLSSSELQRLAYEFAVRNNKRHNFNDLKEKVGKDWLRGFLNRHPGLSLLKDGSLARLPTCTDSGSNVKRLTSTERQDKSNDTANDPLIDEETGDSVMGPGTDISDSETNMSSPGLSSDTSPLAELRAASPPDRKPAPTRAFTSSLPRRRRRIPVGHDGLIAKRFLDIEEEKLRVSKERNNAINRVADILRQISNKLDEFIQN